MHIKRMHEMLERITECANSQLAKGISEVDTTEMASVAEMIKNLACAEKDAKISQAMDESSYEDNMRMYEYYGDDMRYYRGQPRDSRGRFTRRRGYDEPVYRMTPQMYHDMDLEELRDKDRHLGRMYYTNDTNGYEMAKKAYTDAKMNNDNTPESKEKAIRGLENYMKHIATDLSDLVTKMDSTEKNLLRTKMQGLINKIQ